MDESEVRVRGFVGDVSAGGRCLPSPRTDLLEPPSCASSVIAPRGRQTDLTQRRAARLYAPLTTILAQ